MKKYLIIICLIFTTINLTAQNSISTKDSIATFYTKLVSTMKADYLYKEKVNWKQTELELNNNLQNYNDFKSSLNEIAFLFDKTEANHCTVIFDDKAYKESSGGLKGSDLSEQWLNKYKKKPTFEVKVLENQYGYILMPNIDLLDSEKSNKIAQPMYDEIVKVKSSQNIKGWIIDLRFNTGGNCIPMILALYDFLGNNDIWETRDLNKKQISKVNLKNGKYLDNSKKVSSIKPKGELMDRTKIAIIIGKATGSSGEVTALGFKGRENTLFIGEKTYGATTSNVRRDLPYGAIMALTIGFDCDRNGIFYDKLIPDIKITDEDNFDNLLLDGNIKEGIKFFVGK